MKKLLILGGSGFIGKNLTLKYSKNFKVVSTIFQTNQSKKSLKKKISNGLKLICTKKKK